LRFREQKTHGKRFAGGGGMSYIWSTEQKRGLPSNGLSLMQPMLSNVAVLAVTAIFYVWRAHVQACHRRERRLRERVAYMLWVAATGCGGPCRQLVEAD
jgi:hypothetical protein